MRGWAYWKLKAQKWWFLEFYVVYMFLSFCSLFRNGVGTLSTRPTRLCAEGPWRRSIDVPVSKRRACSTVIETSCGDASQRNIDGPYCTHEIKRSWRTVSCRASCRKQPNCQAQSYRKTFWLHLRSYLTWPDSRAVWGLSWFPVQVRTPCRPRNGQWLSTCCVEVRDDLPWRAVSRKSTESRRPWKTDCSV